MWQQRVFMVSGGNSGPMRAFRLAAGATFLFFSLLIFINPDIVAYVIAFLLGMIGMGLVLSAWRGTGGTSAVRDPLDVYPTDSRYSDS